MRGTPQDLRPQDQAQGISGIYIIIAPSNSILTLQQPKVTVSEQK